MTENDPNREQAIAREETAAAREAGSIGGPDPYADSGVAPADRPLQEAGQGESEGFEEAEDALRESAENGGATSNIEGFPAEREQDLGGAAYGDADQVVKSSEVVSADGGEAGDAGAGS